MSERSFSERVAAHLSVLAAYVVFTGLVTTEAYYSVFGIRYQTLQFSATHILYRGLTIIAGDPWLAVPLTLSIWWVFAGDADSSGVSNGAGRTLTLALAALLLVGVTYRIAQSAGVAAGQRDAQDATSSLPRIETVSGGMAHPGDAILWFDDHEMIAFTPIDNLSAVPIVKRILRSEIHELSMSRP